MTNPANTKVPDGAAKPTENVRDLFRKSGLSMTVAEAQGYELDLYSHIFVTDKNALFKADPLNTDPDDGGATTIVDASGNRFVKVSGSADPADVIHDATEKANPVDADELGLVDSAASWVIKKLTFANLWGLVESKISGATAKTTPVDADSFGYTDSAASNVIKKITFANLWSWIEGKIFAEHREKLTGTQYYYVDPSTGVDTNDGRTLGAPFLTIQKAANVIKNKLDTNGQAIVIKLADGTYPEGVTFDGLPLGVGKIYLWGNNATPSNVKISPTSANGVVAINGAVVDVRDLKIETTTIGDGLFALYGGVIYYGNCVFGACASSHVHADQGGACIEIINNEVDGDAASHLHATDNSRTNMLSGGTLKLTGNPNFSAYFAGAAGSSFINKPASYTFDGSATGKKFVVHKNSVIDVNGGGLDVFPGDVDGTWDTNGKYVGRSIQGLRRVEEVVLHDANANASHTGDTVLTTVLSVTLPGGLMGPNGYCKVRSRWSRNSSGSGNAACVAAFGGTTISNISLATSLLALEDVRTISNVNSESVQRALASTSNAFGAGAGANISAAVNSASDVTISFQVALANAGDTATLEEYTISTFYKE